MKTTIVLLFVVMTGCEIHSSPEVAVPAFRERMKRESDACSALGAEATACQQRLLKTCLEGLDKTRNSLPDVLIADCYQLSGLGGAVSK